MRASLSLLFVSALFVSVSVAQDASREQRLRKFNQLRSKLAAIEGDILRPTKADLGSASEHGLRALRILPREKYENKLTTRGGGAYYSLARSTHEYGSGSDIELQNGYLSVGSSGADYGFIHDLGEADLTRIVSLPAVQFLYEYKPPRGETAIRTEQQRSRGFEANGFNYKNRVPAVVGHSYVLRSINFTRSDILVVFKIVRQDSDGSLVLFWKLLEDFGCRPIERAVADLLQ